MSVLRQTLTRNKHSREARVIIEGHSKGQNHGDNRKKDEKYYGGWPLVNRYVLSFFLKEARDGAERISSGKSFHTFGAL